jgi:hypothetical protein
MTSSDLLRYRLLASWRALRGTGTLGAFLVMAACVSALIVVAFGMWSLGRKDASFAERDICIALISDRTFWLHAGPTLIFAYTTFEVIFRASDTAFVALHPISGRARWFDLQMRSLLIHLPLLCPALFYSLGVLSEGMSGQAAQVLAVTGSCYLLGLPFCAWLHQSAGRSLLSEATMLRRALSGQVIEDDAAFLLYAPALGLAVVLLLGVLLDFVWWGRVSAMGITPVVGLSFSLVAAACCGLAIAIQGARRAERTLPLIVAKFREIDVPLSYGDDGFPERVPGEGVRQWLPRTAKAFFLRDLRQLRRRHRLDRFLLWLYGIAIIRWGVGTEDMMGLEVLEKALSHYALFIALFLVGAFRIHGRELNAKWLGSSLPVDPKTTFLGPLVADCIYPLWALLWTTLGVAIGGHLKPALGIFLGGLAGMLVLYASAHLSARRFKAQNMVWLSLTWKAAVVALLGFAEFWGH